MQVPAESQVEGQLGSGAPVVLGVQREVLLREGRHLIRARPDKPQARAQQNAGAVDALLRVGRVLGGHVAIGCDVLEIEVASGVEPHRG